MKKTTTINLAGTVFHIEEDAYEVLHTYFEDLKRVFSKEEGADELLRDIELRFAELFSERLTTTRNVIESQDVSEVIAIMGSPNQFLDEEEQAENSSSETVSDKGVKRLFRDTENGKIGGVSAGLGHYLNIDPAIIRIIWIVFVLVGGSGVLVYLIAWMAMPEAKTTSEKLQMKGQSVNLDNIKTYAERMGQEAQKGAERASKSIKNAFNNTQQGANTLGRVIVKGFGIFAIITGLTSLIILITAFFIRGAQINVNDSVVYADMYSMVGLFFFEKQLSFWMLFLVALIPILLILLLGVKLLNNRLNLKIPVIGLVIFWFLSIIGFAYSTVKSGLDFKEKYAYADEETLDVSLERLDVKLFEKNIEITDVMDYDFDNYFSIENGVVSLGYVGLIIEPSNDSLFHYSIERRSNGGSLSTAKEYASKINYSVKVENGELQMPTLYQIAPNERFRNQKVKLRIAVPKGKEIVLHGNLKEYPIEIEASSFVDEQVSKTSTWVAGETAMYLKN